jgi:hypothetical protein
MADAMHAAIAERIEGIRLTDKPASFGPHKKMYRLEHADGTPLQGWGGVYGWGYAEKDAPVNQLWPGYSADLNLCARAEARIAEMGAQAREGYHRHLSCVLRETEPMLSPFTVATAPASARVRALYAVAMSLKAEPKP